MMADRSFYDRSRKIISSDGSGGSSPAGSFYSREFFEVLRSIEEYYARDEEADRVHVPTLKEKLRARYLSNPKSYESIAAMIDEAVAASHSVSRPNLENLVVAFQECKLRYAIASKMVSLKIGNDDEGAKDKEELFDLIEQWKSIRTYGTIEAVMNGSFLGALDMVEEFDIPSLVAKRSDPANTLPIYPKSVRDVLDGGVRRGHHIVVFARPEAGKTAFSINAAAGLAYKGFNGIYFSNEDRLDDLLMRFASNLTGLNPHDICANPQVAQERINRILKGEKRIRVVSMAPGSVEAIEAYCERYKPDWIVIDQIRNLADRRDDNRVLHLERVASKARNIAKAHNLVCLSVTQAGDSASGKLFIDQGDVDYSNTGIPASADVMIGIGKQKDGGDEESPNEQDNVRGIHLCKNKINGRHERIYVRIVPEISRYVDL
ncbi:MAG: DnaB-like helicase C-terminal domain-containing protein [Candidatus Caldarchaeum sp.]